MVDFSAKGGPKGLKGVILTSTEEIEWPDGNKWKKKKGRINNEDGTQMRGTF